MTYIIYGDVGKRRNRIEKMTTKWGGVEKPIPRPKSDLMRVGSCASDLERAHILAMSLHVGR